MCICVRLHICVDECVGDGGVDATGVRVGDGGVVDVLVVHVLYCACRATCDVVLYDVENHVGIVVASDTVSACMYVDGVVIICCVDIACGVGDGYMWLVVGVVGFVVVVVWVYYVTVIGDGVAGCVVGGVGVCVGDCVVDYGIGAGTDNGVDVICGDDVGGVVVAGGIGVVYVIVDDVSVVVYAAGVVAKCAAVVADVGVGVNWVFAGVVIVVAVAADYVWVVVDVSDVVADVGDMCGA